ncbi:MAG TPA: phage portal protein [Pseudobacteroides sp.]|uniref:phage portal protein n=1 Tax=Pseudobacteroides TaxID=1486726 RepID=UPI00055BD9DD|nr:phage portal protein [Pseudobacteroides cellulosolvens]
MNLFQIIFNKIPRKIAQETGSQSGMGALFGRSSSGKQVNEQTAMQAATVYACVKILAETIASLPLHTYRRTAGGKEKAYDHYLYELLHSQPNSEISAFTFFEAMMAQILIWGNAYAFVVRDANGKVLELWPLRPEKMQVGRLEGGDLFYSYDTKDGTQSFRRDEVLHVPGLAFDGVTGQSPISYAKNAIGMSLAAEEYGSTFFANGANPGGVLEHPGVVKDPKRLRESWESVYRGSSNAHKIAVLEEGMKFSPIAIPPEQAQFLETRKFQTNEICRIFRVPPHMVGDLERATFSNIEYQSIEFVVHTIRPWLVRWEQAMKNQLLLPDEKKEYFIRFNVDGLLRGDFKTRQEGYSIGIQNGFLSPNDVRELEDLNLIPDELGGNRHMINGSMIDLKDVGKWADKYSTQKKQ